MDKHNVFAVTTLYFSHSFNAKLLITVCACHSAAMRLVN